MLIVTQFFGPTDHRGSRVKAKFVGRDFSITVSYDHGASDAHAVAAEALVAKWNAEALAYSARVGQAAEHAATIRGTFYHCATNDQGKFYVRVQDCTEKSFRVVLEA